VPLINNTLQRPRVAKEIVALSASVPPIYAVVIDMVNVIAPEVLLKITTASPAAKVALGTTIDPLAPTSINSPTSPVARV
jgi:hypothetical protein